MDWTLFWQIAAPIIGLLGIGVMVTLFLWPRREKVVITHPNMLIELKTNDAVGIQFEYWFSLIYVKGVRNRYVSEIWVELDKKIWGKVNSHFKTPLRLSRLFSQEELVKLELGKAEHFGLDAFFPARSVLAEEEYEELDNLVQRLWHQYKIGWKDTYGKTQLKTIHQLRELNKLFKK